MTGSAENAVDLKGVKTSMENLGFPVKEISKDGGIFILEYNYPSDRKANAMRAAFLRFGGEAATYYRLSDVQTGMAVVMSRERVIYRYNDEEDLRRFISKALNEYLWYLEQVGLSSDEDTTANVRGQRTVSVFGRGSW